MTFKRKEKLKKFYPITFNNNKNDFDRISANSKKEALEKIKKFWYPNEK